MEAYDVINREDFETALATARRGGATDRPYGLAAPLDAGLRGRVAEVWEKVEHALKTAFEYGVDRALAAVDTAVAEAERLLQEAGRRAREVHAHLLGYVQDYLTTLVDSAIARVPPALTIGTVSLPLRDVAVARRISLTGSLKAAITEACALTGGGEVTVTARYGAG